MKFFRVKTVEETMVLIKNNVKKIERVEKVSLVDALDRVLGEDVLVLENIPSFVRSSVDGYAVIASDTYGSSESMPGFLEIIGEVRMGEVVTQSLMKGQAIYVPTGGMLPTGSDAMLMIEHCEVNGDLLSVNKQIGPNENVIRIGEDYAQGRPLLMKGTRLRPQELGALAANGINEITVYQRPVVAYLSSGDEIVQVNTTPLPIGKVRDINAIMIETAAKKLGCDFYYGGIVPDIESELRQQCQDWLVKADCLIISGGSSVGTKDYSVEVIDRLGEPGVYVHGVAVKPGKPTILASAQGKPIIGLPGHPASALVIFQIFGHKILSRLAGETEITLSTIFAKVSKRIASAVGRTDYIRVRVIKDAGGLVAEPVLGKSGLVSTLVDSDGLLIISDGKEGVEKHEVAEVILL